MIAKGRWWLIAALALAQLSMLVVTVRHDSGEPDEIVRYGFPIPYTWFSQYSSLHWDLAPLAWLVDLLALTLVIAPLALAAGALVHRGGADPVRWGRRAALALGALAALAVGLLVLVPAVIGWRHLAWELPPSGPRRTIAVAPFPPH